MFKNFVLIIILSYCFSINSYSQSRLAHEVAVVFGPAALQSDYSQKTTLSSNLDRLGFGIGIAHFLNFSSNRNPLPYVFFPTQDPSTRVRVNGRPGRRIATSVP